MYFIKILVKINEKRKYGASTILMLELANAGSPTLLSLSDWREVQAD